MPLQIVIFLLVILVIGLCCLIAANTAFRYLERKESKKQLDLTGKLFFYRYLSRVFFPTHEYENLYLASIFTQNAIRFCYAILSLILAAEYGLILSSFNLEGKIDSFFLNWPLGFFTLSGLFLFLFVFGDLLGRCLGNCYPERSIKITAPLVSSLMLLLFPMTFVLLKFFHKLPRTIYFDPTHEPTQDAKQELIEIIEEADFNTQLDPHDRKLIESVMEFKDRIAREVMVPRVDIFSLCHDTSIEKAATLLYKEGYSRTPVYKETLDNIIGVLMYKDVLAKYMEHAIKEDKTILQSPISSLVKSVLYTPETKKISHLLQDFRKQQVHLAIIVDEYGGTEGIVTIEDILEEIVGDIADEYDEEEALYLPLPEGGWLIDARMNILDIEEQFKIEIPQDGDYDTIGGYIFHQTGMIPPKGYILRKESFELEVLRSDDRRVEKLRIKPLLSP
ncbi:MAG: hemolysin family protein [Parachlamydiaceae bacterium]